ncbi:D-2-hydroxyglutarate dehydrogenase YdiJ [Bradyrhizobium embrapense]|uniref:D-2-hydroxyglutarate dehydrogenase YdiJ n=1 Tax=Bradyrhizobium embrapense TaxID=630921 RepID=UPI00067C5E34|nr:FAD-binding and (Fe-S)-binding domain-containing protein [Bradyrhizobium embrapense]
MIPRLPPEPAALPLYGAFCAELRARGFAGDLTAGNADRTVMATDNSIYQLTPQAIAFPLDVNDLVRIAKLLGEERFADVRIAPRGGGTGTNGQSLTEGLVVDLSRHMNRILAIDPQGLTARVEAGVVKDQLNAALKSHGLFFAPELSTSNRATIGGMISTDACGQGSCLYGKTRDHVLELTTVLSNGSVWHSRPLDQAGLAQAQGRPDLAGSIHREVDRLERENATRVAELFPKLNRCLTGYDLAHVRTADGRFDLNAILCGSEGTLGFLAEATLKVLPLPSHTALVNVRYDSFDAALRDAQVLVPFGPASIETVDSKVLALAQDDLIWADVTGFFPEDGGERARGVNLVEFVGNDEAEVERAVGRLASLLDSSGAGRRGYTVARGAEDVERIWDMRKKSVGLLGNMKGDKRPIPFVEDTAVPREHLADYIAEFRAALDRRGLDYGMFGHVDAGVLHVRPAIDMKAVGAEALVRDVTEEVVALTQRYGGLLWGEHGKGVRSEFSPRFFGPLYPVLQAIKAAFDPRNQFNPGKIAVPEGGKLLSVDGVPTKGNSDRTIPPVVRAGYDEALHCNGNGACFNWDPDDAMCPSWKGTRERRHSPKGRAQLMREWLRRLAVAGSDPLDEARRLRARPDWIAFPSRLLATLRNRNDFSHEIHEAMAGCLACKSCSAQCPIKIDVPTFRAKFLELYHGRYLRPLRHHLLAALERLVPWMAKAPKLFNLATATGLPATIGLVHTPPLSNLNLDREIAHRGVAFAAEGLSKLSDAERLTSVVIVQDAFTSYYDTRVLLDLVDLLTGIGLRPWLSPYRPNGKPLHVHGFLGRFEQLASANATALEDIAASGVALIGLDPSMTLTYRSEYAHALPGRDVPQVQLVQEWLAQRLDGIPPAAWQEEYWLLPHCTERTTAQAAVAAWSSVFEAFGLKLSALPSGCCGMAGTYGHEREHRAMSERIYQLSWAVHVAEKGKSGRLLADGYSCRSQAKIIDGVRLRHPIEVLCAHVAERGGGAGLRRLADAQG